VVIPQNVKKSKNHCTLVHKHEILLNLLVKTLYDLGQYAKKVSILSFQFLPEFRFWRMLSQETIFANAQKMSNQYSRMLSIGEITRHFKIIVQNMLSRPEIDFIAGWAYKEHISSLAEHTRKQFHDCLSYCTRKCLKVEYVGQNDYNFQKYRVTCPWDHKDSVTDKKISQKLIACVPLDFEHNEKK
jgi:hypothetical protein